MASFDRLARPGDLNELALAETMRWADGSGEKMADLEGSKQGKRDGVDAARACSREVEY